MNTVTEKGKIRLFIALDLPLVNDQNEPIQFANAQLLISQAVANFRPVKNFHVTLVFIGSVNESLVPAIKIAIERAVAQFSNEQKQGLINGIGQLMLKPGAAIMGKNAVALSLIDNYLIESLIATLLTVFQQYQIPHAEGMKGSTCMLLLEEFQSMLKNRSIQNAFWICCQRRLGARAIE